MSTATTITDPVVERFVAERDRHLDRIQQIKDVIAESGREFTGEEKETIGKSKDRIGEIDGILALIADDLGMTEEARARISRVSKSVKPPQAYSRAGEVLFDLLHLSDADSSARLRQSMSRAAEHMGTNASQTVATAGDLGGLIVTPVVGPVISPHPSGMPLASVIGLTESSTPNFFMRPRIDDPSFATSVGPQVDPSDPTIIGVQKGELPSKAFNVVAEPVQLSTIGTYLNISQQLISLQAGALDLIVAHMLKRLGWGIENAIVGVLDGNAVNQTLADTATGREIIEALYTASATVFSSTGELATWVAMGPQGYARLGRAMDAADRPLFPTLGAANAPGTMSASEFPPTVAGLRAIVTPAITNNTFYVGGGGAVEGYIFRFPVLEAIEPSVLGRQVAVAASVGGYAPIVGGAVHLAP